MMSTTSQHTTRLIAQLQNNRCFICHERLDFKTKDLKQRPNVDHYVPTSLGGDNVGWNKVIVHTKCNTLKDNKLPTLWPYRWLILLWIHYSRSLYDPSSYGWTTKQMQRGDGYKFLFVSLLIAQLYISCWISYIRGR